MPVRSHASSFTGHGRGYVNTTADEQAVKTFKKAGGTGPLYGKVTGAFASSVSTAKEIAKERSPNSALGGALSTELALPRDFEAVAQLVREDDLESALVLGNDPAMWREKIDEYDHAGFTHVCLHDVSTHQDEFIEFARQFL